MADPSYRGSPGPFTADQLHPGDTYELTHGHPVLCVPTGGRGARRNLTSGAALDADPAVDEAGVDAGYSASPGTLRAPDIAVGNVPDAPGWVPGVPPLAVEFADTGQDENDLKDKIRDLLDAGTQHVWVVRLAGPRCVEVHQPGRAVRIATTGEQLLAPGVLKNPVPVDSFFDRNVAHEVTLRNLIQRKGYESLEEAINKGRAEGEVRGRAEALLALMAARGLGPSEKVEAMIRASTNSNELDVWIARAATVSSTDEIFN